MLGSPNLTLTYPDNTLPIVMRPTQKPGVYIWELSGADQPVNFSAKTSPSEKKSRFSSEYRVQTNALIAGQPDTVLRVYTVVECDNIFTDAQIRAAVMYSCGSLSPANIMALRRGEI